jgi:two-component system, LytTR family, response regulator
MNAITAIIIDDEWLVRSELRVMLQGFPQVRVVAEAANVSEGLLVVHQHQPDVIFLDIQLAGETGFDFLDRAHTSARIIFITAFDQFAIRAFEVHALDYLLKPIRKERLADAIQRVQDNAPVKPKPAKAQNYSDIIYVLIDGSLRPIKLPLLKCITAEGNYSYIYYQDGKRELVLRNLGEWMDVLPENPFLRIHRSTIVNYEYVEKVVKLANYSHAVYIRGMSQPFTMSRRYAIKLKRFMA